MGHRRGPPCVAGSLCRPGPFHKGRLAPAGGNHDARQGAEEDHLGPSRGNGGAAGRGHVGPRGGAGRGGGRQAGGPAGPFECRGLRRHREGLLQGAGDPQRDLHLRVGGQEPPGPDGRGAGCLGGGARRRPLQRHRRRGALPDRGGQGADPDRHGLHHAHRPEGPGGFRTGQEREGPQGEEGVLLRPGGSSTTT